MSKIISKPVVYVLGAQEVRASGFSRFLQDHKIDWQSDTEIPSQVLIEAAGRTCFDDRTELLTRTGWKPVSEVSIADEIATLNPETRHLEYQKPIAYHEYDYKGDLLTTEGRDISFAVTPEHRQFVSLGGKFDWKDFNFIQTKDLPGKRFKIITAPENWIGEFPEKIIFPAVEFNQIISNQYNKYGESTTLLKPIKIKNTKVLSELIAHYIANGSICSAKGTGHGIVIYGREFKEICSLAQGLGFKTNVCEDKRNGCKRTKINGGRVLAHWFEKECGRGFRAKRFPQWIMNLPKEQLHVIWSILVKTDGHRYKNGREIVSTGSITISGQLQEMLCKMGFSSYITCKITNDVPCWTVSKKAGNLAVRSGSAIEKVSYVGKVYCPTTNNGIVYIRRNGKVHFSGNCYMSFEKPRPGGNKAYLAHIKEVGHGCYDIETEVLTSSGWKFWPDVTISDKLATLNPITNLVEYHEPIRLINYEYEGKMYRVDSQHVDLLVTPNHKMFVCKTTTKEGRKKNKYNLIKCTKINNSSHAYLKNCDGSQKESLWKNCPNRDVFALLGFSIGDGSINGRSKQIRFHLHRDRKIAWLKTLMLRLKPLGYILTESDDRYSVELPDDNFVKKLFFDIYDENNEKQIPLSDSIFLEAGKDALEGLYEGLIQSDGSVQETCISFDTTSPNLVGQFQQLCLHIGLSANICYTYDKTKRKNSYGNKPLTRLCVNRRCNKPEVNKWSGADGKTYWVEDWEGEVFCAEVPNNILYVRRNGKPVWSGNSVLEHGIWNFLFTNVSRSLTHELVRHRAGMSYSQLSQRYVDEANTDFIVPSIIEEDKELYEEWLSCVAKCSDTYKSLTQKITEKLKKKGKTGTDLKKTARQAARSVLPNATETKIFVTGNVRSIRHFLEQRGNAAAEWEIRQLANIVLDVMMTEAPHLFGDYNLTPLEDGTFEIKTPYPKV